MRGLLALSILVAGCPSGSGGDIREGYVPFEDIERMGPRIWEGRSAGRKGLRTTLATESHGFGTAGRMDVVVVEVGDRDESMLPMVGDRLLLRVDVTGAEPVVEAVDIPVERSEVLAQSLDRSTTRLLHTGGATSAIAAGRMDGQLREGVLALYDGGAWQVHEMATREVRIVGDTVVADTIDGILRLEGTAWVPVEGDALGPADDDSFTTLTFEPGRIELQQLDRSGRLLRSVDAEVGGDRELHPVGVIDNGSPDDFVAVLSDCDLPIGELWRFSEGAFEPVRPSRLGALEPSGADVVHAADSFHGLPGEPAFREIRQGALAPWLDSRSFWGHGETWACEGGDLARCKPRSVTGAALPDPSGEQVVLVSLDETDSHPRIHLRQQALPWQTDPTRADGCDDERCINPDDPDDPKTECVLTTSGNQTCVAPGTVAGGERVVDSLPLVEDPLSVRMEPADLDDEDVWVDPLVCGFVTLVEPPADYEAVVHSVTRLDLSAPGYLPISVNADPAWLDGASLVLNRGERVGPIDVPFYAYANPELMFVASEEAAWSYATALDEWRQVEGVEPALPLEMHTIGTTTMLRNREDQTWFLDGRTFRKLANYPIDFEGVAMAPPEWWVSFDPGRGTLVHDRGTVRYIWSWTGAGPAIHHDVAPDGNTVTRILDDGSVVWHQNRPAKTEALLPAGWYTPGSRAWVLYRFNSINPSPVVLARPAVPMSEDADCLLAAGGCELTYLYDSRETPLSSDAFAFAKHREAAVWVDGGGVHRGTDGLVQTDASLGIPEVAAGMLDLLAFCTGTRCSVRQADAWPMTELVSWDERGVSRIEVVDFRTFVFRSDTRTLRYDRVSNQLTVVDGSADDLMATGQAYRWRDGLGAFASASDPDAVFARGEVHFPATDMLSFPTCIPFAQTRYVEGEPDGWELVCAAPD